MTKNNNDDMSDFEEWKEHQYNPGYWVNKIPPILTGRRTKKLWVLVSFETLLVVSAFFFVSYIHFFVEKKPSYIFLICMLGIFSFLLTLRSLRFKPEKEIGMSQEERDAIRRKENQEKTEKNKPKRRKDYR